MLLEKTLQSPVDGEKEEQGNPRQSSQPRTTRSQNVSIKVASLWTLHAEGGQFRDGPNGSQNQRPKKKRSSEETGWTLASASRKLQPCAEIVTRGDSSFIESPEVGDDLKAQREIERDLERER